VGHRRNAAALDALTVANSALAMPNIAGLLLDPPVDFYSEFAFPSMSDFVFDEAPMMVASLDPTETP